jgi:NAD(P)-dependent dehydrogenase (short-subunit alcohol dehydrogenase family)
MEKSGMQNLDPLFSIKGRTIVITGAGGALMGTTARGLAERGARLALLDINDDNASELAVVFVGRGGEAKAFHCDVTSEESALTALEKIRSEIGKPDGLINGAGGNSPSGSTGLEFMNPSDTELSDTFFDIDLAGYRKTNDLNYMGTVVCSKVFGPDITEAEDGSIINISSMTAYVPLTKVPAYSAAKSAVSNFTHWLAVHVSKTGTRVNAVAPGFFMTEQLRYLHINQETGEYTDRAKKVINATPFGRYGEPEELLGVLVWLLSPSARFVTGTVIPIDGGFSSYSI